MPVSFLIKYFISLIVVSLAGTALSEYLGDLDVVEVVVKPRFALQEPSLGSFSLRESGLTARWKKGDKLSAWFRVGSKSQISAPIFYRQDEDLTLGIYEGFARYEGIYGAVEMGLVPVRYGALGAKSESQIHWPRPLLFSKRWVGLRDFGFSFFTEHRHFFTRLLIHNGEGGDSVDQKTWVTMNWGWDDSNIFKWIFSAQTGETDPASMQNKSLNLAGVDRTKDARWRIAGSSIEWTPEKWKLLLDFNYGELEQIDSEVVKYAAGHFDVSYMWAKDFEVFARIDMIEPNGATEDDEVTETSFGLAFHGEHSNSVFSILGTRVEEAGGEINNDRLVVQWTITPLAR